MHTMNADQTSTLQEPTQADRLLLEIRKEILSMVLAPGEPVSERLIQKRYGMSRTPIRAALATLVAEGLVNRTPNGGYVISPIDLDEIRHLFEYREEVEAIAVRLACRRASPQELAALRKTVDRGRDAFEPEDWLAAGHDVHVELAALSGNPFLRDAVRTAVGGALRLRWLPVSNPDQREAAWVEHTQILDAVIAGDEEEAVRRVQMHTRNIRDQILEAVETARRFLGARGIVERKEDASAET